MKHWHALEDRGKKNPGRLRAMYMSTMWYPKPVVGRYCPEGPSYTPQLNTICVISSEATAANPHSMIGMQRADFDDLAKYAGPTLRELSGLCNTTASVGTGDVLNCFQRLECLVWDNASVFHTSGDISSALPVLRSLHLKRYDPSFVTLLEKMR
jgi:hypothetical protein